MATTTIAVCLGRFQPVHCGHLDLVRQAGGLAEHVLVVIGSAQPAVTPDNPFSWQERREMLYESLSAWEGKRVHCLPLRDCGDTRAWTESLLNLVVQFERESLAEEVTERYFLGNLRDSIMDRHPGLSTWCRIARQRLPGISAREIRETLYRRWQEDCKRSYDREAEEKFLRQSVSQSVWQRLLQWQQSPQFRQLALQWSNQV